MFSKIKKKRSQHINRERKNQSKKRANTLTEKGKIKEKKKPTRWRWNPMWRVFLEVHFMSFLLSVFYLFWRENFFVDLRRKHIGPIIYFSFSLSNQTYSKKKFLLIFFSKFSIHHISPPNKHTLDLISWLLYIGFLN